MEVIFYETEKKINLMRPDERKSRKKRSLSVWIGEEVQELLFREEGLSVDGIEGEEVYCEDFERAWGVEA